MPLLTIRGYAASILLLCCSALLLNACGAGAGSSSLSAQPGSVKGSDEVDSIGLPTLASLGSQREVSAADRTRDGSEFSQLLPSQRTFVAGSHASFVPAGNDFGEGAFAIYTFPLAGYNGPGSIKLTWTAAPAAGKCYVAVANFSKNRWQWFKADSASVSFDGVSDFTNSGDRAFVAVMLTGTSVKELNALEFGVNQAPVPVLHPQYYFADPNQAIVFDGSESSDDGSIVKYEWDLNGDGSFETDTGAVPSTSFTYPLARTLKVKLRVTDNDGQAAVDSTDITIDNSGYDEVEPNNTVNAVNTLPAMAFSGFDGNVGPGGYDGGNQDYYVLPVTEAVRATIRMDMLSGADGISHLALYDPTGVTQLASSDSYSSCQLVESISEPGNYILVASTDSTMSSDYRLSSSIRYGAGYDEVEPNNSLAQANLLDPLGVTDFWANLGAGGYDGGTDDWFAIDVADSNNSYDVVADFQYLDGDVDIDITDSLGTVLVHRFNAIDGEEAKYNFTLPGRYYIHCYLKPDSDIPNPNVTYLLSVHNYGPGPTFQIVPDTPSGAQPLTVTFNLVNIQGPGGTSPDSVDWDLDGDGLWEDVDHGAPASTATFFKATTYHPRARLTLDNGAFAVASCDVTISGGSSEVEPNDDENTGQSYNADVANFFGDCGPDAMDPADVLIISAGSTSMSVDLDYDSRFGPIAVEVLDSNFDFVGFSAENDGHDDIDVTDLTAGNIYYVIVYGSTFWPGNVAYKLNVDS